MKKIITTVLFLFCVLGVFGQSMTSSQITKSNYTSAPGTNLPVYYGHYNLLWDDVDWLFDNYATIDGTLTSDGLSVDGDAAVTGSIDVDGTVTTDSLSVEGNAAVTGNIDVDKTVTTDSLVTNKDATINGQLYAEVFISDTAVIADSTSDFDVSNKSVLFVDTDTENEAIIGLSGGQVGQFLVIVNIGSNNLVLKDDGSSGEQDLKLASGSDETLTAEGGLLLVFDGTYWRGMGQ
jgi:cytoskeletal protein CcmA (bactofilin family)